jgi:hypothetical protein
MHGHASMGACMVACMHGRMLVEVLCSIHPCMPGWRKQDVRLAYLHSKANSEALETLMNDTPPHTHTHTPNSSLCLQVIIGVMGTRDLDQP